MAHYGCAAVCSHQGGVNRLQTKTREQYCSQQQAQLLVQHIHMSMQAKPSEQALKKKRRSTGEFFTPLMLFAMLIVCPLHFAENKTFYSKSKNIYEV